MASSMGGMFPGQQQPQPQPPPGAHPPPPGPVASGSRAAGNTLVDDLEASFEVMAPHGKQRYCIRVSL